MNWLKELFFCETWTEFWVNLGLGAMMLAVLWVGLWFVIIFFEVAP